ncbi:hypothetical protein [Kutzneria kofuensis]|uniref:hypothetical protein n=1 Tax=Kutzneria kofuensis TaxID=103725 RepID=UPI0031F137BD
MTWRWSPRPDTRGRRGGRAEAAQLVQLGHGGDEQAAGAQRQPRRRERRVEAVLVRQSRQQVVVGVHHIQLAGRHLGQHVEQIGEPMVAGAQHCGGHVGEHAVARGSRCGHATKPTGRPSGGLPAVRH